MPWQWMAPESLSDYTFSTKSDVWSYGITLFEYFSCAATPYAGILYGEEFLNAMQSSSDPDSFPPLTMGKPPYASDLM